MALVRGYKTGKDPYWMKVVRYCVNGGLQAVLSEYAHVLRESLGFLERNADAIVPEMARVINDALSIRAANYSADEIRTGSGELAIEPHRLRARYALRFGAQSLEDDSELQRAGVVRTAFNSPFWPFVLATTSVGQEGLDFHQYCHAVVHWNLPANPVDLEQREGRVHRYKGHAIRKNLATVHRADAFDPASSIHGRRCSRPRSAAAAAASATSSRTGSSRPRAVRGSSGMCPRSRSVGRSRSSRS